MSPVIDVEEYIDEIKRERARKDGGRGGNRRDGGATNEQWPHPKPLPAGLAPVEPFTSEFLPDALAPWVEDIANRLQCPLDYVGVTALTALGAVIGRRIGVKPQAKTDWIEIPNVWGGFIGRPGMLKSPAMGEALRPIHRLEAEAAKGNEIAQQAYAAGLDAYKLRREVNKKLVRDKLKANKDSEIDLDFGEEPKEPTPVRYRTNDTTYEGLGELLITNPTGILVERDELTSLLKHLDRDDQSVARGFYLSGWSGTQPYTFDRIMRGHRHIEAVCISVLGNTQPARIVEYVRSANLGAQVATASSSDSDYCPGPTREASGVTLMNTPTARRARKRGRRSSVWQNWTPKRRLGSEQKKGPSTKCRVCASGKRRTKTSSGGGLIWKGDCAPARCHPCWEVTSRNTANWYPRLL